MKWIEKESGFAGLIVRPLSAKLLDETIPEQEGWIDRELLGDISGRSRQKQIELAQRWGINNYPQPAGGCLLTDENFSRRLRDILKYSNPEWIDIELLKVGRHFRVDAKTKIIVGRCETDNQRLLELVHPPALILNVVDAEGPITIICGESTPEILLKAGALTARYSDARELNEVRVTFRDSMSPHQEGEIKIKPQDATSLKLLFL